MYRKIALIAVISCANITARLEAQEEAKPLSTREAAIADIGAAIARGEQNSLATAYKAAFAAGLTLNEAKEITCQLYAYCGFPRALNAAATLRIVADDVNPKEGPLPGPAPKGDSLLFGTAVQTKLCGREVKGGIYDFVPQIDQYLKAHLFGDIFGRDNLSWREREIATIGALAAKSDTEPQLKAHLKVGPQVGLKDETMKEIVTRIRIAATAQNLPSDWSRFGVGEANKAFKNYFRGRTYRNELSRKQINIATITFEPGARSDWHIHQAKSGGGEVVVVTAGRGIYVEEGKSPRIVKAGDTVNIPAGAKHWQGAAPDEWLQYLEMTVPGEETFTEWCGEVDDEEYGKACGETK